MESFENPRLKLVEIIQAKDAMAGTAPVIRFNFLVESIIDGGKPTTLVVGGGMFELGVTPAEFSNSLRLIADRTDEFWARLVEPVDTQQSK